MGEVYEPKTQHVRAGMSEAELRAQGEHNTAELRRFLDSLKPAGGGSTRPRGAVAAAAAPGMSRKGVTNRSNVDDDLENQLYAELRGVDASGKPVDPVALRAKAVAAAAPSSSAALPYSSQFVRGVTVQLNPYAASPLVDDLAQANPTLYKLALRDGPAPKLFETGDLPIVCASGLDPQLLMRAPAQCRHAIAADPSLASASSTLQDVASQPDAMIPSPGLADYGWRVSHWASGVGNPTRTP